MTLPSSSSGKVNKLICFVGDNLSNTETQKYIASHFNSILCDQTYISKVKNLKTLNPYLTVFGYGSAIEEWNKYLDWSYVNQHESWFLHNISGGRVYYTGSSDNKYYIMNPSSGWADYLASKSAKFLNDNPQFNSIILDNTVITWNSGLVFKNINSPLSKWDTTAMSKWHTGMETMLEKIRTSIQRPFMSNCWVFTDASDISGIHMWELFIHGKSHSLYSPGYGLTYKYGVSCVELLRAQAKKGIIPCVVSGTNGYPSVPTTMDKNRLHQLQVFTLCSFLFTVNRTEQGYYAWATNKYSGNPALSYFPELDTTFGQPKGEYFKITGWLYGRAFTYKKVLVNFSPEYSYSTIVNGIKYTLGPRTGKII
jgi:hypothetical protein